MPVDLYPVPITTGSLEPCSGILGSVQFTLTMWLDSWVALVQIAYYGKKMNIAVMMVVQQVLRYLTKVWFCTRLYLEFFDHHSSYSFINVTCQNARTCITYSDIRELYELKKLIDVCTLRIVNMLVNLTIKRDKVSKVIYITGKSSNVIKTTVKTDLPSYGRFTTNSSASCSCPLHLSPNWRSLYLWCCWALAGAFVPSLFCPTSCPPLCYLDWLWKIGPLIIIIVIIMRSMPLTGA